MRTILTGLFILLLVGCGTGGGGSSSGGGPVGDTARVQGLVTDPGGQPVAQALVILGDQTWTTLTDNAGNFLFTGIPVGTYPLRVLKSGYLLDSGSLQLQAGTNTTLQALIPDPAGDPPSFSNLTVTPNTGLRGAAFTVSLDITDHSGSGIAQANLVLVADNQVTPLTGPQLGGTYSAQLNAPLTSGNYHYELFAADNLGHVTWDRNSVAFTVLPSATVTGRVTQSPGGQPVAGAAISDSAVAYTATTDSDGAYTLTLPAGIHTIISQKTGFQDSRFQDLTLTDGQDFTANLIQYPPFNLNWATGAVNLQVTGIQEGQTVSGPTQITVNASGANPIRRIQLRVGNYTGSVSAEGLDTSTLTYQWDPAQTSLNGPGFIYLLALDRNYNWCVRQINLQINHSGGSLPGQVDDFVAYSYTYGENIYAYSKRSGSSKFTLPNGRTLDLKAAPPNTSLLLSLSWIPLSGVSGYRISRSINAGAFQPLADVPAVSEDPTFNDTDPALTPGQTVRYQIRAYNGAGLGPIAASPPVTILGRFTVQLLTPAHEATEISLTPTFSWSISSEVGDNRSFKVYHNRKNGGYLINGQEYLNQTSLVCPVTLEYLKVYEWDLFASARGSWSSARSEYLSFSYPREQGQSAPGNTTNGSFIFTTKAP